MSTAVMVPCLPYAGSFRADAPRPPVPGEEGVSCQPPRSQSSRKASLKPKAVSAAPRREEAEAEGSACLESPVSRWTRSLLSLLADQDGAQLFRSFLEREAAVDTLDFWFACNGFRQMDLREPKTLRVAKAIHKRYVEHSAVSRHLKPATRSYIKDTIKKQQIDSAMFDQAQTEIQTLMEENSYQMFLTSDIYLQYIRTGGENALFASNTELGSIQVVCAYLPTLNEEEEWICPDLRNNTLPSGVGLSGKTFRASSSVRCTDSNTGKYYGSYGRNGPANPYHNQTGCIFAPASSANDSEISSDVMTDDSMSMTDSSVDGIPPYRHKKQQQREMQRSVKANGQVSLPHFPRTHRLPKEMTPVDPAAFATQLISRLEKLKRERDTMDSLEERLQQIKEDEGEDGDLPTITAQIEMESTAPQHQLHPLALLPSGSCDDDPQTILDDHLSRVLKTPGCQSPGVGRYSPPSQTPDCLRGTRFQTGMGTQTAAPGVSNKGYVSKQGSKYVHHHYIHHHTVPKTKEQIETEAAHRVQCLCPNSTDLCSYTKFRSVHPKVEMPAHQAEQFALGRNSSLARRSTQVMDCASPISSEGALPLCSPQLPCEETDRTQNVWQWMLESERQPNKHRSHSVQCMKRGSVTECPRGNTTERTNRQHVGSTHQRGIAQPSHPFIQDPAMPPLPPPNTLAQLEEARRRLEEEKKVSKTQKQRNSTSSLQRDRPHGTQPQGVSQSQSNTGLLTPVEEHKAAKKQGAPVSLAPCSELVVTYYFCGEDIPYRRMMKGHSLTLAHFKEQLSKKGNYRYYFKRASNEFDCGAVFEEVQSDDSTLPMYEGKILGKVERID
ncbi:axin-2 isoform X2 [Chiloscyllium plagiosum]|uniref:axin-2 isoform X2 n=1 Tax=Chiloscyllium plagiosum TaxID=36176 RepID=UPI001CB88360|nr:axin-2 isoform X2 [Chiloscyllium plagiosum]